VRPSAFAVFMLTIRSNLVGCSTGMSAGFAPCSILSTKSAARRISAVGARQQKKPPLSRRPGVTLVATIAGPEVRKRCATSPASVGTQRRVLRSRKAREYADLAEGTDAIYDLVRDHGTCGEDNVVDLKQLDPPTMAAQLRKPEGEVGLALADSMSERNWPIYEAAFNPSRCEAR